MGFVLISPKRITIEKSLRLGFSATNNEAKYEALLTGIIMVQKLGRKAVEVFTNSRLLVAKYAEGNTEVCQEVRSMPKICIEHSPTWRGP